MPIKVQLNLLEKKLFKKNSFHAYFKFKELSLMLLQKTLLALFMSYT
jgi:hypothetical protein